jgi:dihydrofolate reductase
VLNNGWGENPPFQTAVFVLTHHARDPLEMEGGTTFHFVTDGIHAAWEKARTAAGSRDINLGGGANVVQQYPRAGLVDEMGIHVVPLLLDDGARLFENTGGAQSAYECVRIVGSPAVTHCKYRRK